MPRNIYDPIKLNQTNRYAGYQFHARIRMDRMTDMETFHYVILSVYKWVQGRVPENDRTAPELRVPAPEEYDQVRDGTFTSFHLNIGFALDITPLTEQGIWALRIKETDSGLENVRQPVVGRFFTTRVGVRLNEKGYTELGIKIDVTDPASEEKEVDFAFRPAFVRSLAIQPSVRFEQVRELTYGQPMRVNTEDDYKRLLYMLDNEDNQLPLAVFTHYRPGERKPAAGMSMEEFIKSDSLRTFLQAPGIGRGSASMPAPPMAACASPGPPEMPYDPDKFSRSAFAYALTYVLGDRFLDKFRSRIKKEFASGDILLCGTRKFRGGVTVIGYPGSDAADRKKAYDQALLAAQSYSKHKSPYDFGTVVFEAEARKMEQHARVMELVNSSSMEDKEKIAQMSYQMELLLGVIDDKDEDIEELKNQKEEAFSRGQDFGEKERTRLEEENIKLRKEKGEKQDQIDQMQGSFEMARDMIRALDAVYTVSALPETNEDVVQYYRKIYAERIDFTERGASTAAKCDLKPASLWNVLYVTANGLVDLFRNSTGNITEKEVQERTGYKVSFGEGSMTRENTEMMRLREDVYEGKVISVEPHLKLKAGKGETENQRLHFWYDPEKRRIVIGYLGEHLDSVSGRRRS